MAQLNPIQVEKLLKGIDYPVNKAELVKYAERHGADEQMKSALMQLPDTKLCSNGQIWTARDGAEGGG